MSVSKSELFNDSVNSSIQNEYAYDNNGNMLYDSNGEVSAIQYNLLNLPDKIHFTVGHKNLYTYNAGGQKLKAVNYTTHQMVNIPLGTITPLSSTPSDYTVLTTDYVGNIIYENGTLKQIMLPDGYWQNGVFYYYLKDHLGSNRVTINSSGTVVEKSHYYPSGLLWAEGLGAGVQNKKYNGKEFVEMHGLDEYDSEARWYYPAIVRTTTQDPHCESYYDISPYSWCGNNFASAFDPDGRDYWSTNDPATIARFLNSVKQNGGSGKPLEFFNYSGWNRAADAEFIGKLTYNDENQTFYSSYGTVENGESVIHGIKIKASGFGNSDAFIKSANGKWSDKSSGAVEQVNVEFALLVGISKVGYSALRWVWNNVINPPAPSTVNTFNANTGKSFRPGKQNSRDANLKQFPKDFQRWFHRFGKEGGSFNATTQDLREMFDEWVKMGKPQVK